MLILNIVFFGVILVLSVFLFSPELADRVNGVPAVQKSNSALIFLLNRYYYVLLSAIFIFAVGVRAYQLGMIPPEINADAAMAGYNGWSLALYGTDKYGVLYPALFTAWGHSEMSVLLSYLMVPFIKLLGFRTLSCVLPSFLISVLAIFVLYKFSFRLLGRWFALAATAIAAIDPWQFMQSRWALDANMLPHFLLFSVYFLYLGLRKQRYLYLSMLFFGLCMYTYGITYFAVPLMLVGLCAVLLYHKKIKVYHAVLCVGVYLLIAWPIFGVMIVNYFKLRTISLPFVTIPYYPQCNRIQDIALFSPQPFHHVCINLLMTVCIVFLQMHDYCIWNSIPGYGTVYVFTVPLIIFGTYFFIRELLRGRKNGPAGPAEDAGRRIGFLFLLIWLTAALVVGLLINYVNINRINIVFYPLILLASYALFLIGRRVKLSVLIFSALFLIGGISFFHSYFTRFSNDIAQANFVGFSQAIRAADTVKEKKVYITSYTHSKNSSDVSEVLTLYYEKLDPLYFQGKKALYRNGKKLPPFKRRYVFICFKGTAVPPDQDAAYVVNNRELSKFSPRFFRIEKYRYYSAVFPKKE